MGQKLYEHTGDGGLCFKSNRKPGEVRIANYAYDLWLPLLGATAIGVYAVYCRLERNGTMKGKSMRDVASACRIGDRKLNEINDMLEDCGFIRLERPQGHKKLMHWTTEITVLDPPREVSSTAIDKYKLPKTSYKPLAHWLVEDEQVLSAETLGNVFGDVTQRVDNALPSAPKVATLILQPSLDTPDQSQTQTQEPEQQDGSLVEYELTIDAAAGVLEVAGGKRTVPSESEKNEAFIAEMGHASPPKRIKHTPEEIMASAKRASARGWANRTSSGETTHRAFEKALAKYGDGAPALRELQAQIETSFGLAPNWSSVSKVKEWTNGLSELYAAARGDISIAIAAAKKLRNDSMTMATPYSIVITAQSIAAERATAHVAPSARAVREYV